MCMGVWAACVYVYHVLAWCLEVRVLATLELELQSVCEVSQECWELNLGPLQEQ